MTQEHPFAQYVRILGKGPNLSRPLTFDETRAAATMILDGAVEPVQLGAFLCLLRVKTETPPELAGLIQAARDSLTRPQAMAPVDLDWGSYAGKSRQLPWFLLAALALARSGVRVLMHGTEGHTAGRLYTREALAALGVPNAASLDQAARQLDATNFAFIGLEQLSPPLFAIMGLKPLLGLRSPIHSVGRMLNPAGAAASMAGVTHPAYRDVHQEAARLLGQKYLAVFKGDGGEAERRPEKPCTVFRLIDGQPSQDEWDPTAPGVTLPATPGPLDPARLAAVWRGDVDDPHATATVTATMAVALTVLGRAGAHDQAQALAETLWAERVVGAHA